MIFIVAATHALSIPAGAQLENIDKAHRALIERGLQIQGQNLAPSFVLKDVLFIPGQHMDGSGKIVDNTTPTGMREYPSGFFKALKDPWIRGVHSIANLGSKNNGLNGDVLLAWFHIADESLDGPNYSDEWYFMVINVLVDTTASGADTRQNIQLNFVNGVTKQVQRLSRDSGKVDLVDLELIPHTGGRRRLIVNLDGSTAELFKFKTGAPFVGVQLPGDHNQDNKASVASAKSSGSPQLRLSWAIVLFLIALGLLVTLASSRRTYEVRKTRDR